MRNTPDEIAVRKTAQVGQDVATQDTARLDAVAPSPAAPSTGAPVFASRRERKLYETGAISLPKGEVPKTTEASSGEKAGVPVGEAASPPPGKPSGPEPSGAKKKRSVGAIVTRVLAALIALAGLALLVVGGLKATVWAPSDVVVGTLGAHSQKFVTTEVGALALAGPRLQVQVSGAANDPVFVGIGRASDVDAYLGETTNDRIVGLDRDQGLLITRTEGSDAAEVLDPASADVWAVSSLGQGSAKISWPDPAAGQWRLVIATDGTLAAPQDVTLTWSGDEPDNPAPAWIAVGVVLLVAGVITSMLLRARARDRSRS